VLLQVLLSPAPGLLQAQQQLCPCCREACHASSQPSRHQLLPDQVALLLLLLLL
jgi:hypothetical protein